MAKQNELIRCACGCGTLRNKYDKDGKVRIYCRGHNMKKPTKIEVKNDLIIVIANNTGNEFVFDYTEDLLKKLSSRTWSESRDGYLYSYDKKEGKRIRIYAHHFILPKRKDLVIDHIDQDKRNNRSSNLI